VKRVVLFVLTNLAVMVVLGLLITLTGLDAKVVEAGLNYKG